MFSRFQRNLFPVCIQYNVQYLKKQPKMSQSTLVSKLTLPEDTDHEEKDPSLDLLHYDEGNEPFVLLLGWAGAEDRYLSVYSRIYEAEGIPTLRCITPLKTMFLKKRKMPLIGEEIVNTLHGLNLGNRPVFVHCFSNGGSFMYQHFSNAIKNNPGSLKIKGVIFDSAPSKRRLSTFYRALRPIVGGSPIVNIPITLSLLFFCILIWIWEYIQINLLRRDIIQFKPLNNLLDEEHRWPQHFIYSKSDDVVPFEDIEFFANYRRSLGVNVSTECFKDTQHVKHYRLHKVRYKQSVYEFMMRILDDSMV